jgi:signal peptidase II
MMWFASMLTAALVAIADQVSKTVVLARQPMPAVTARRSLVAIRCVLNRRGSPAALVGTPTLVLLWALTVILALLFVHGILGPSIFAAIGVGAAVGGATGNVLDRMRRGAIVDFIAVGPWPVFNLADAAIVTGAGLVLITLL